MDEPLDPHPCRQLIREILENGNVIFSGHALEEMADDNLSEIDVHNVLRGARPQPGEYENGSWRYRLATPKMAVIIAFRSEEKLIVVTAWRF